MLVSFAIVEVIGDNQNKILLNFELAPLSTRRDVAMLGIIHRSVLRLGCQHLHKFFVVDANPPRSHLRRHSFQLVDPYNDLHRDYINRSVLGYVWVYNLLPQKIVNSKTVKTFQKLC